MFGPIVSDTGPPPNFLYMSWIEGRSGAWPISESMTKQEDREFRSSLRSRFESQTPQENAVALFQTIRSCTAKQITTLQQALDANSYALFEPSIDPAIQTFGKQGNLFKMRALYPAMDWGGFLAHGGVQQSLSSQNMPLYIDDVLEWYSKQSIQHTVGGTSMLLALLQCPLDLDVVVAAMHKIKSRMAPQELNLSKITENIVSNIYDLTEYTEKNRSQEVANQLTMLHAGWGIEYPLALVTLVMQEQHHKTFKQPPVDMLGYQTANMDIQVANVFRGAADEPIDKNNATVIKARLVDNLYQKEERLLFCVDGGRQLFPESNNPNLEVDTSIFQDTLFL